MIKESGISKHDQVKNHQTILDVIEFMTDAQNVNIDDHALSKFTNFETVYVNQLGADNLEYSKDGRPYAESARSSPRTSPSLPKRPISPAKPPRKILSSKDRSTSNLESVDSNNAVSISNLQRSNSLEITIPASLSHSDSSSLSKAPASRPKPPTIAPKPVVTAKPASNTLPSVLPLSASNEASIINSSTKALPIDRPVVPSRPLHTLGISSTDVKSCKFLLIHCSPISWSASTVF